MNAAPQRPRPWYRLHGLTCVALVLASAVVIGANLLPTQYFNPNREVGAAYTTVEQGAQFGQPFTYYQEYMRYEAYEEPSLPPDYGTRLKVPALFADLFLALALFTVTGLLMEYPLRHECMSRGRQIHLPTLLLLTALAAPFAAWIAGPFLENGAFLPKKFSVFFHDTSIQLPWWAPAAAKLVPAILVLMLAYTCSEFFCRRRKGNSTE